MSENGNTEELSKTKSKHFQPQIDAGLQKFAELGVPDPNKLLPEIRNSIAATKRNIRLRSELQKTKSKLEETVLEKILAEQLSLIDHLTGLPNRRWFEQEMDKELLRARRTGTEVFVLVFDIDHFKAFNDWYGHKTGDEVLKLISQLPARKDEPIARIGGEEFGIILMGKIDEEKLETLMTRFQEKFTRDSVEALKDRKPIKTEDDKTQAPRSTSLSMGVSQYLAGDTGKSLFDRADAALYKAKQEGRNQGWIVVPDLKNPGENIFKQITLPKPLSENLVTVEPNLQ